MGNRVALLTTNFFHPVEERLIMGGAERYQVELCRLLRRLGFEVEVWQIGNNWTREFDGVKIHGIPTQRNEMHTFPELNTLFYEASMDFDYAIYFVMSLAYPVAKEKSIGVSHGIYWDWPGSEPFTGGDFQKQQEWFHRQQVALRNLQQVVSVDTNTINFFQAVFPGSSWKFRYIPNFVDTDLYCPPQEPSDDGIVRVLFPRRLAPVRGLNEAVKVAEHLTARYPNVEFHFCGRGHTDAHEQAITQWAGRRERCYYYWKPMHLMPSIYQMADIVIIPSRSTEGTSLAALEAMACGRPVIAGLAGGLTDLIIHGYNGYLIQTNVPNLEAAVEELIRDPVKRREMGRRAREVALAFRQEIWARRWVEVIEQVFN
ncbi:MAG: hypothetical protein PWP65_1890 [Clostridia bacterium]|nr:hypothetical protein [Clostridia bacterium]